jgi:transposase
MRDKDLYATILGIRSPWSVTDVQLQPSEQSVEVRVALDSQQPLHCPVCAASARRYDSRERRWRHLDTCQYRTILVAEIPRVECGEHGVHQVYLPWAEPGSHFTALFEGLIIDWLKEASISAVARQLRLTWDEVDGVMQRAVARGLARRTLAAMPRLGVDETSFAKRHEYVTVVTDIERGRVVHVADDRGKDSLVSFYSQLTESQRAAIEIVAMDMWEPYIRVTEAWVPQAQHKIVFDKFHVAQHLGDAVDKVRRQEHRELLEQGDRTLLGTKYLWLQTRLTGPRAERFEGLRRQALKVAKAWQVKEVAMELWWRRSRAAITRDWLAWCRWAKRVALEPVQQVARMVETHLGGIVNAVETGVTNALSEAVNGKIQWIKRMARGFRNRNRFRNAIYFHLGGLDLYPAALSATHTNA